MMPLDSMLYPLFYWCFRAVTYKLLSFSQVRSVLHNLSQPVIININLAARICKTFNNLGNIQYPNWFGTRDINNIILDRIKPFNSRNNPPYGIINKSKV